MTDPRLRMECFVRTVGPQPCDRLLKQVALVAGVGLDKTELKDAIRELEFAKRAARSALCSTTRGIHRQAMVAAVIGLVRWAQQSEHAFIASGRRHRWSLWSHEGCPANTASSPTNDRTWLP